MADLTGHPNLKIFRQFGFISQGTSGPTQVVGHCPFCASDKHFYVNPERKTWDCKSCHREGGYQKFLKQIADFAHENFRGRPAVSLSANRGLQIGTFKKAGIGYLPELDAYTIPEWDSERKSIWNLRIYKKKKLHNCVGSTAGIYGWEDIQSDHEIVWICEGEWDRYAMQEILLSLQLENHIAVSIPGANIFKAEWTPFFQGKIVYAALDNDFDKYDDNGTLVKGAGKIGSKKLFKILKSQVKELKFVNWPETKPDKFDVRDLYNENENNAKITFRQLSNLLRSKPKGLDEEELADSDPETQVVKYKGKGCTAEEVYAVYRKWLFLPRVDGIDAVFGTLLANRLPGDPVWLFLVGASGSGKTDIIMSVDGSPGITAISSLTPKTLISGSVATGGGDASLIPKLNGRVLCIKDFTTILEMNSAIRDDIFGQLRDAYDGECAKPFGTGGFKVYKSKFGIIAGTTRAIEIYTEGQTALGERFLKCNLPNVDAVLLMERAMNNILHHDKSLMRKELKDIANRALDHDYGHEVELSSGYCEKLICLAQYISTMRGTVMRDKYTKEITHRPFIELGTRVVTQLSKLSIGICLFTGKQEMDAQAYRLVKTIARSSAPSRLEMIVRRIWKKIKVEPFTDADICAINNLPSITSKRLAENMHQLGIVECVHGRNKDKSLFGVSTWRLTEKVIDWIERSGIYNNQTEEE
jgi:hypothetical protein